MRKPSTSQIAQAIYQSVQKAEGKERPGALKKVVAFMARRKLLSKAKDILTEVGRLESKDSGILEAEVVSARHLDESTKSLLAKFLKEKYKFPKVVFSEKVDPSLLDGLRVKVADEMIDLSAKGRIKKLENYLISKI